MDRQAFLDKTWTLLKAQGEKAVMLYGLRDDVVCVYRHGYSGHGCAIGVHLPLDAPTSITAYEGSVSALVHDHPEVLTILGASNADIPFLRNVQMAHDLCASTIGDPFLQQLHAALAVVALAENLTPPPY